jgi:formate hydrogenlyase transcriptional activator
MIHKIIHKILRIRRKLAILGSMRLPLDAQQQQALILRVWEAVSTERELQGVLQAVGDVLAAAVPYDGLGIVSFDEARHDLMAMHLPGMPLGEKETLEQYQQRSEVAGRLREVPGFAARPLIPYPDSAKWLANPQPYLCDDLLAKEGWMEHEFKLAAGGVRSYCSMPLEVRRKLIGIAAFSRLEPVAFTPEEVNLLSQVCRAVAVAVANALANEQIRALREKLAAENISLREQLGQVPWFADIVGDSAALRRVLESVEQVAGTAATVLLTGETGTGKELIARAIHRHSPRAHGPLVKVNCAAIPETLLASELFGHERGAFTGASERRKGRFEQAHGGTLFLDEIGEMPSDTQAMLLRVLQEREFERLGGSVTVTVDVRIVTATNRNLEDEVRAGRFRSDLYYRLNVFPIRMPALRERRDDISLLVSHFAKKHGERLGRAITAIDARTMEALGRHSWPGNVRELENVVERAVIQSRNGRLVVDADTLFSGAADVNVAGELRLHERDTIESALRVSRGRVSGPGGAAKRLGMPASTLEFRIKRLGIDKLRFRSA